MDGQRQLRGEGSAAIKMTSQLGGTLMPPGTDKSSTKERIKHRLAALSKSRCVKPKENM